MHYTIEQYTDKYYNQITELIEDDEYENGRVVWFVEQYPQFAYVAIHASDVVGVCVYSGGSKSVDVVIYVKPEYRRNKIGSALLSTVEEKMIEAGVQKVECAHIAKKAEQDFMQKHGYIKEFSSDLMIYTKGKLPDCKYEVIPYEDKYYVECHNVIRNAFHRMQVAVGLEDESFEYPPNELQRKEYLNNAESMYLMRVNNEIVAALILDDEEIDILAVDVKHQHKGYGREMMAFAINKILDEGYDSVELWCIVGNTADIFYEKLGFEKVRTHDIRTRTL
jgi:mycothiol synthase